MNIVDIIILLLLAMGAVVGFKNGVIKQTISFVGFIVVVILSFLLKGYVSSLMYQFLPFFSFGGALKGVTVLNFVIYEVIAFLLVFSILMTIFEIILRISGIVEKILKYTIILGIPSKLLGMVVGAIEGYIVLFIALYCLSLPVFQIPLLHESSMKNKILNHTPVLSSMVGESMKVFDEFADLKEKYDDKTNVNEFNKESLDLFLKYKIVSYDSAKKLIDNGKLKIDGANSILEKYENGKEK